MNKRVKIIECPRDAMQGWPRIISTEDKIRYLNCLVKAGFDVIDCGSFVSPKAIPQMADTADVIPAINLAGTTTQLLVIIANLRGAEKAAEFHEVKLVGYPFSISETFQQRNTNSGINASLQLVKELNSLCRNVKKDLVVYLSMAFGNPYGDEYNEQIVERRVEELAREGVGTISIADTVGLATPAQVYSVMKNIIEKYPQLEIGVHLHATPDGIGEKVQAALDAGCRRFDGAIDGIGGCPMAGNALVGNMDTGIMLQHLVREGFETNIDMQKFQQCSEISKEIFK